VEEAHDSSIIETAEEVEVPELALAAPASEDIAVDVEPPVSEPPVSEPPVSVPPVSNPLLLEQEEARELRFAAARSDLPPPNLGTLSTASPAVHGVVSTLSPAALPPTSTSPSASTSKAPAPISKLLPPAALATARKYPVLWLVAAPVLVASVLVVILAATGPEPRVEAPATVRSAGVVGVATAAPVVEPAPTSAANEPAAEGRALAALAAQAAKDPSSLSVSDLLLLDEGRAERQRAEAQALAHKLLADPELAKDPTTQTSLLRFAADPATASEALAAIAQARSPVGADLLFEVWTSRSTPPATAELARSLLYSRDVRPGASPALAAALDLRTADSCEAAKSALPKVQASGDTRSIPALIKLTYRRGCGASKRDDCYACLRASTRELVASTKAANRRRAPLYPAPAR
jgi:hypothetical protein